MTPGKVQLAKDAGAVAVQQAGAKIFQLFKDAADVRDDSNDPTDERYAELDRIIGEAVRQIVTLISVTALAEKKFPSR